MHDAWFVCVCACLYVWVFLCWSVGLLVCVFGVVRCAHEIGNSGQSLISFLGLYGFATLHGGGEENESSQVKSRPCNSAG